MEIKKFITIKTMVGSSLMLVSVPFIYDLFLNFVTGTELMYLGYYYTFAFIFLFIGNVIIGLELNHVKRGALDEKN